MQFSISLMFAVLMIQSQTAYSTFLCNDKSNENLNKVIGICVRKIKDADRQTFKSIINPQSVFLAQGAIPKDSRATSWTCDGRSASQGGIEAETRFCTNIIITPRHITALSQDDINTRCYTRDGTPKL